MMRKDLATGPLPTTFCFLALVLTFLCIGCGAPGRAPVEFQFQQHKDIQNLQEKKFAYPETRFVVLSDPHYYHPSLGTAGPAFEKYIADDRKMLAKSDAILDAAIERIRREKADFILICGDLTKDGEKINHLRFAEKIGDIHPSAPVYVVPGNHDVSNGISCRYTEEGTAPVENVSPAEFSKIYADFGYGGALIRDAASLSYVAEPVAGLWILALDSCLWRENRPGEDPITDGRFSDQTLHWIEDVLIRAKKQGKAVIGFMHHGLVEHYPANEKYYGEYIVDEGETVARLLAAYGVRMVFTGHFHAQDITAKPSGEAQGRMFDIETGSLVTYPCPYRKVHISGGNSCTIESRFIRSIDSMETGFPEYARKFAFQGTIGLADKALSKYRVTKEGRDILSPQIAEAYLAHLAGDENRPEAVLDADGTGLMGRVVVLFQKDLVEGWWTDLPPSDNRVRLDLSFP